MNPYKAAIALVRGLYKDNRGSIANDRAAVLLHDVVDQHLSDTYDWIAAETNGLEPQQILNAHEFPFEGGASGRRTCDACYEPARAHMLVTRYDTQETKETYVCKAHMLDPGPLLDW